MRTAQRIDFVDHTAVGEINQGGRFSTLTVDFRVFSQGPAHVAGITYTADFWATPVDALARFQAFDGDFEVWQARVTVPGSESFSFEYVIFCKDFRGDDDVPEIFNTNGGETFRIKASL
jgi:hypothetical protein